MRTRGIAERRPPPSLWSFGVPRPWCRESSPPRQDSLPSLVIQVEWHLARAPGAWLCVHKKGCTALGCWCSPWTLRQHGEAAPPSLLTQGPLWESSPPAWQQKYRKPALASQGLCFRAPPLRLPWCQELQLHHGLRAQGAGSTSAWGLQGGRHQGP